jgi:hypothetical protein
MHSKMDTTLQFETGLERCGLEILRILISHRRYRLMLCNHPAAARCNVFCLEERLTQLIGEERVKRPPLCTATTNNIRLALRGKYMILP